MGIDAVVGRDMSGPWLRPLRRSRFVATTAMVAVVLLTAACSGQGDPLPTPTNDTITYPTGSTDVVLRLFEGGGFVPPGFLPTEGPQFTLYGDGTVIFREATAPTPTGQLYRGAPWRIAKLSANQVRALLAEALDTWGLRTAASQYTLPVADAPSTTFTINADGVRNTTSVNGLGIVIPAGSDAGAIANLGGLRDRLLGLGPTLAGSSPWQAERYRGYLLDSVTESSAAIPWAWPAFTPATWTNVDDGDASLAFPTRIMSRAEVDALGLGPLPGGATGIVVVYPATGGKLFGLSVRPLLPDETS